MINGGDFFDFYLFSEYSLMRLDRLANTNGYLASYHQFIHIPDHQSDELNVNYIMHAE